MIKKISDRKEQKTVKGNESSNPCLLYTSGVGQLIKMAVENGRATRPNLRTGICGEHGGEQDA